VARRAKSGTRPSPAKVAPPEPNVRAPVMEDVARLAGVSLMTVSRVLNSPERVSPKTLERVKRAMAQLEYSPNLAARSLVTRRSAIIGVVSWGTTLYGPASVLHAIGDAATAADYYLSVASLGELTVEAVQEAVGRLSAQSVDGLIVLAPLRSAAMPLHQLRAQVPVVTVQAETIPGVPMVCVDQQEGARLAVEHLLDLGHDTVHHIRGPLDWFEADGRVAGWRNALDEAHRPAPQVVLGDWTAQSGYEATQRLLDRGNVTAIFAGNDHMALGAMRALYERDIRVPGDISLVGFDDIPEAPYLTPSLTTVRQDFPEVGRLSVAQLLGLINGAAQGVHDKPGIVPPSLIVRESSSSPG
jgi:DNA-binding LacI/PurR family transcriptional regulator